VIFEFRQENNIRAAKAFLKKVGMLKYNIISL
jgi:hypothetical protein